MSKFAAAATPLVRIAVKGCLWDRFKQALFFPLRISASRQKSTSLIRRKQQSKFASVKFVRLTAAAQIAGFTDSHHSQPEPFSSIQSYQHIRAFLK